jgi:hypothetical protein
MYPNAATLINLHGHAAAISIEGPIFEQSLRHPFQSKANNNIFISSRRVVNTFSKITLG